MSKNLEQIVKTSIVTRTFKYVKDDCTLNFTLRIDVKSELAVYELLLEQALIDVKEELAKHK